ncbi:MAG: peptidoglycan-binding protein, partial [Alteromonadales bacterium]|nr:peptidoglycan-binding protein [Alteromonadales bacterium]
MKVTPDGNFGENTRKAVIDFQKKANITADGIVGKGTWAALANATTKVIKAPERSNGLPEIAATYIGVKETGN